MRFIHVSDVHLGMIPDKGKLGCDVPCERDRRDI